MRALPLDPLRRRAALLAMSHHPLDVLVVGGGVVGTGAALDAASRGLRVGLVEAGDWASGTSSRSSKLIHCGLRYLEQLDFALVREALRERSLILDQLAPHLARPVPFLYPLRHRVWERAYAGTGIALYDGLGGRRGVPSHRHLSKKKALAQFPGLRSDSLVGAIRYYDGQVDDARHTLGLARTAVEHGALAASSAAVTEFLREDGRVVGARVLDVETGDTHEVRARAVVNAAGVWTDELRELAGADAGPRVRMSKGVHLLIPRDRIAASTGLISKTEKSVLFVIPWDEHWIVGTTDTEWTLDRAHPAVSKADVDYLLDQANRVLARPLTTADVVGVYAGLRPLLDAGDDDTTRLSREHAVATPVPGLVMVAGGKYTTYRVMARDAVDAAVEGWEDVPPSCTERLPLVGADGYQAAWNRRHRTAADVGLSVDRVEHLLRRHGTLVEELWQLLEERPDLREPLAGAPSYLRVEAWYAVAAEGALHLDDVLCRRTRISITAEDRGVEAAAEVAELVAPLLGWDAEQVGTEVERYRTRVEAELAAQRMPDDAGADAARRVAVPARPTGWAGGREGLPTVTA